MEKIKDAARLTSSEHSPSKCCLCGSVSHPDGFCRDETPYKNGHFPGCACKVINEPIRGHWYQDHPQQVQENIEVVKTNLFGKYLGPDEKFFSSMTVCEKIFTILSTNEAQYIAQHHEPTITSADAARVRNVSLHAGAKALVIQGKKSGNHWLCVMPADLRFADKKFEAIVGEKVSFAKDPETVTGCVRGSVPPLGSVIGLKTYCSDRLKENERIHFNAGSLTDSVTMKYEDYVRIEKPELVDITE